MNFSSSLRPSGNQSLQSTLAFVWLGLLTAILVFAAWWFNREPPFPEQDCRVIDRRVAVCAASDMARFTRTGNLSTEHAAYSLRRGRLALAGARNEVIAFQLVLRSVDNSAAHVAVTPGAWRTPSGQAGDLPQDLYAAHYHFVDNGGYTWGPDTEVLAWPDWYPDALVPQARPCRQDGRLFDTVNLPAEAGQNQSVWIDTWIPPETVPGVHTQQIRIDVGGVALSIDVDLTVHDALLPARPGMAALGEIYAPWQPEGLGFDIRDPAWQAMSQCYQQLAHRHRMVFIERFEKGLDDTLWPDYVKTFGPALDGKLFTAANGYRGPGEGEAVTVWRPPWTQRVDVTIDSPVTDAELARYRQLAQQWTSLVKQQGWTRTQHFAYLLDEVDGPQKADENDAGYRARLMRAHRERVRLQQAIDEGAGDMPLDLLWTSHSNPAPWVGDPAIDLTGLVRLWAPNGRAAEPRFLAERTAAGETAWFYHSGHPAIGAHSINASGIEMRTWGVIAARYGLQGQFMWAINLGDPQQPFARPSWKPGDDRFGNGLVVYPGHALEEIGYASAPGPIPSMRLKAWRRGLQDAELYRLALERHPEEARRLIHELVPRALAEGQGKAAWSRRPADWIGFHGAMLRLASTAP